MSKRRLNHQQKRRIADKQQQRLEKKGKQRFQDSDLGQETHGLVAARYSRNVDILALEGEKEGELVKCHIRANLDSICVGDRATWQSTPDGRGVLTAIEPRSSEIIRPDGLGKLKAVAANIDQVFIVIATEPTAHPNLIDRYLLACEHANIEAAIVLNKCDLEVSDELIELLTVYRDLDYPVHLLSAETGQGMDELREELHGKISIFAGQSGVGKSSMINTLLPDADVKTGALSHHVTKGTHTTTTSNLYCLKEGGYIIDSPGIREFHLYHFSHQEIYDGFRELKGLSDECQFRDCRHEAEPGCAVKAFIENDGLAASREQSLSYILHAVELMR